MDKRKSIEPNYIVLSGSDKDVEKEHRLQLSSRMRRFFCSEESILFIKIAGPYVLMKAIDSGGNFAIAKIFSTQGEVELAASGLITSGQLLQQGFLFSPLYAVGILSGIAAGANNKNALNASIQSGLVLALILSVPMTLFARYAGQFFKLLGEVDAVTRVTQDFFDGYSWGAWADVLLTAFRQHAVASEEQNAVFFASLFQKSLTIGGSCWLMFGKPNKGGLGVGWSYSVSSVSTLFFLILYLALRKKIDLCDMLSLRQFKKRLSNLYRLVKVGGPIALHVGSELAVMSFLLQMSGDVKDNDVSLGSAELVFQYTGFAIRLIVASSQATGILVGKAMGKNDVVKANRFANTGYTLGFVLPLCAGIAMFAFPRPLTDFFIDSNDADYQSVLQDAKTVFAINGITIIPDFFRNVSTGSLRGLLDTAVPMLINAFFNFSTIGTAYLAGFVWGKKNEGIYGARSLSILIIAVVLMIRWCFKINKKLSNEPKQKMLALDSEFSENRNTLRSDLLEHDFKSIEVDENFVYKSQKYTIVEKEDEGVINKEENDHDNLKSDDSDQQFKN